ncbi:MAG: UDP-N-acetylmuramoyl-tripeptide--D-alanyl-D-alanine ligase [Flavobacterium sp.]|nr:UDP-N-acetylmuramoyl-tripeptide--D-alanyl-D-alanine ligase [Flavobacterium sp.]
MTIADIHALFLQSSGIVIDTRKITPNAFFVALKGDRFDANTFAAEALQLGASHVLIDDASYFVDHRTIVVSDALTTLQELAHYHRTYLGLPIIALTGSNGKTTTKELIHAVLSQKYACKATVGNLNNHIGVPLTLLSFDSKTEIGIVEMGANHQKEIEFLCALASPDFGYITNFGKAHLEGFGGVEGVIKGKSEMYTYLLSRRKKVFINADDPIQLKHAAEIDSFTFSAVNSAADIQVNNVQANPFVSLVHEGNFVQSQLIGLYNATNICAAIAIGSYFSVSTSDIHLAIANYIPTNNRSQILHKNSNEIILDAYNANPSSMAVAIANFAQLQHPSKIMILGDMFELGEESSHEHAALVNFIAQSTVPCTYFVGPSFYAHRIASSVMHFFKNYAEFEQFCTSTVFQNSLLLIKGSRGMALERIVELM